MKPFPDESYESWVERVRMFEHGAALQEIALGKPVDEVMEKMSKRMMDKFLHPIYKEINSSKKVMDMEESRRSYQERYIDQRTPVADHVDGQIFDKDA
jgi:glutamyl-tRNA reductase